MWYALIRRVPRGVLTGAWPTLIGPFTSEEEANAVCEDLEMKWLADCEYTVVECCPPSTLAWRE